MKRIIVILLAAMSTIFVAGCSKMPDPNGQWIFNEELTRKEPTFATTEDSYQTLLIAKGVMSRILIEDSAYTIAVKDVFTANCKIEKINEPGGVMCVDEKNKKGPTFDIYVDSDILKIKTSGRIILVYTRNTPSVATIQSPSTSAASPGNTKLAPSDSTIAFVDLYGILRPASDQVTLSSGEKAKIWYSAPVDTDSGRRFVIMVARTNPEQTSRADGAKIDVVSYREEAGQWKEDAKAREVFGVGSMGIAPTLTKEDFSKIENHPLKPGLTGIFLPGTSSGQGYSTEYFDVLAVESGTIKYLGQVETGGENSGACDSTVTDGTGTCYDWKGTVQVEPPKNEQPSDILVKRTGTDNIDSKIVPAQQVRYVWAEGKGYVH
jgi:hypothetical protein